MTTAATREQSRQVKPDAETGVTSLCKAFQATVARHPDRIALRTPDDSVSITFAEYAHRVERIAGGLAALGVKRGDTVALMLTNRPEFNLVDTAALHLGATPFSIYNTSSPEQIAFLFSNAGNDVVIAEEQFLDRIEGARAESGLPARVVSVDGASAGTTTLAELETLRPDGFDFEACWRAVEPDDVATLIYTSGTTGPPKGVETTHRNMLAQCRGVADVLPIPGAATITSYLPSAHIADRWSSHYNCLVYGVEITCVDDPRAVAAVLPSLRPTIWGAVPRVLEKIKAALEAGIAAEPEERRNAIEGALELARKKVRLEQADETISEEMAAQCAKADETIFAALRAKLGLDRAEWVVVGAAPLSPDVFEFMTAVGLPISEVYGMSEASCIVTAAPAGQAKLGKVGPPIPGVEVRLADDGELLIKGPTVMRGYRGQPEKTSEAIDADGWLHSGDIAEIDEDGHVKIVDRKKELIINAAGKNMSPANIESALKSASPLIGQACCIGDARPYNVALLVLDPDAAAAYGSKAKLADASVAAVAADQGIEAEIAAAVERANAGLSRVEQIKRFELLTEEWLPGRDELTPTMKLKRKPIAEKYAEVIDALYAEA